MIKRRNIRQMSIFRKKQKGVVLIDTIIGISLASLALTAFVIYSYQLTKIETAEEAHNRIAVVVQKLQQYYMDRLLVDNTASTDITIYPQNMAELQAGGLIPVCSAADFQNQLCVDYTVLPWGAGAGEEIIISRRLDANGFAQATITFNINTEQREDMRRLFRRELGKIFGYTEDAAGQVTYTIDRPSESVMLSGFVSTDGQTPMQPGSWDFGGSTTLDNVQDISFAGITDRTAITGLLKNGSVSVSNIGGVRVTKPSCPATYSPTITTYLIGLGGNTEYSEVGNFDTWYEDRNSTQWSVHIRFAGLRVGQTTRAWHYVGSVGFFTWCDL